MTEVFTYSILQFKRSLANGEALNVGILFSYSPEEKIQFFAGNTHRVKLVYPDFDIASFKEIVKGFDSLTKKRSPDLFSQKVWHANLRGLINEQFFKEDSTSLQFLPPVTVVHSFRSIEEAFKSFALLLLPGTEQELPQAIKYNEPTILKFFTGYVFSKNSRISSAFLRDRIVKTRHFDIKFDLSWQNGITNFVKPLSFDLLDSQSIQSKAATYFSYLGELGQSEEASNSQFDLLISKPQNNSYIKDYERALDLLKEAAAPKKLVVQDKWVDYYEETIEKTSKLFVE